jgi:threonine dehydratase
VTAGPAEPTTAAVHDAAQRIAGLVHRTPLLTSRLLDDRAGAAVVVKCEHLQKVGAFKARGATNAVRSLEPEVRSRGVACHSSGNHGQALAWAARQAGVPVWVVVPETANPVKVEAIRGYGATVVPCAYGLAAREERVAEVLAQTGATEVHPYDQPAVIAGAGTAALELLEERPDLDVVIAPVGGGGLLSGTTLAADGRAEVWGAEPLAADDAARSLATGTRQDQQAPDTIADGLTTSLSERTFRIINGRVSGIATVSEDEIVAAMRFVWTHMKQLIEPSAAVPFAVVLRGDLAGRRVGLIASGGNVDLDSLPW